MLQTLPPSNTNIEATIDLGEGNKRHAIIPGFPLPLLVIDAVWSIQSDYDEHGGWAPQQYGRCGVQACRPRLDFTILGNDQITCGNIASTFYLSSDADEGRKPPFTRRISICDLLHKR